VATITQHDDDALLPSFGYKQQFVCSLRHFESFAVAFSFISITTGIFTTYQFALTTGGPRSIWTWLIVAAGQALVALVYGSLAAKVPLSGYSYQWASRLANVHVGWWLGWMSFAFLSIVTVSVDYGLVQVAFQPLIGEVYTPTSAALETLVVLAIQAALIIWSTRMTTRVNNTAVATEVIGILGLTVLLLIVAAVRGKGHWSNLASTGIVSHAGYYGWLGPFMLATLLGAYTIVGFEASSNLAEETHEPHRTIPRAMIRAVLLSGAVGMVFLIALSYATSSVKGAIASQAPVAFIVNDVLGGVVQKLFLVFVCVSIFACGLVIMVTNGRLIWSMSRDRRLPGHQLWSRVPRATGGPTWATILAAVLGAAITLALRTHTSALITLFTASTIMPAVLYTSTVLLYVFVGRRHRGQAGHFSLGRWEMPVIVGALVWLAYELIILIGPSVFRDAQYYVLGALGVGLVIYVVLWLLEPAAMRSEPGARGADALTATALTADTPAGDTLTDSGGPAGPAGTPGHPGQPGQPAAPGSAT
jgi:amino acid transporter